MDLLKTYASRARVNRFTEDDLPSTLGETIKAARTLQVREENSNSADLAFRKPLEDRAMTVEKLGGDASLIRTYSLILPQIRENLRESDLKGELELNGFWRSLTQNGRDAFNHLREYEKRYPGQVKTDDQILDDFKAESAELRATEQDTLRRGGAFGAFLGTALGVLQDPLVLATLPLGASAAGGRTALATIGRVAAVEGSIAAVTEIPIQAEVFRFKREIESPWSFRQSAINVLAAGVGGTVLGGAITGGVVGARKALSSYRTAKEAGRVRTTPELDEAEQILEDTIGLHDENPLTRQVVAEGEEVPAPADAPHERAIEEARAQHEDNRPVDVQETVRFTEPEDGINQALTRAEDPGELIDIDPTTVAVDADTFQFKSGGDGAGVNDTLREVTDFDRRLAGVSLIWERADGTRFIADGHQRQALALRALAAGQDPAEVRLNGFLLREADGVTAIDARRMAAVKNMAEGSGSALDAAKILRDVGPVGEALLPPLPPNSALVRQARGLKNLSEDAFLQVVNDIIPERFGALVGSATLEPKLQQAMIGVLRKTKPANETQARSIIDQVRTAGTETRVTEDLFGEQQITESLILERAQVLDAALRDARKDKAVFGRLLSDEGRITEAGTNRLDRDANFQRQQEAADAANQISRLANTKGPISEALTEAARQVTAGKSAGDASQSFLEAVRREIGEGDIGGVETGGTRPVGDDTGDAAGVTSDEFDFTPARDLTPEQLAVETDLIEFFRTTPLEELETRYAKLDDTNGGQTLSVDAAREFSPAYLKDRTLAPAVQEPASAFIKRLYAKRLADPLKGSEVAEVVFTAGGTGAGKTSGLRFVGDRLKDSQIIMDGNLAKAGSAIKKIEQALEAGKTVNLNYVFRDPIEALVNGSLPRAMKQFAKFGTGRTVPIDVHARTHGGSNKTIRELAERFADDDRVNIMVIDNSNGKGNAALSTVEKLPEIDEDAVITAGLKAIDEAETNGKINQEVAAGSRGEATRTADADRPGNGGLDQPGGARGTPGAAAAQPGLTPTPTINRAPRSIVREVDDVRSPAPEATRTGTVPDTEYDAVLAAADDLIAKHGEFARVGREIGGEIETRSLASELESLDALEETLESIRICSVTRAAA